MKKPQGRKIKKQVGQILELDKKEDAVKELSRIPARKLAGPLFSYFYSMDDLIRFRSTNAMGSLAARVADKKLENARIILRRLMWNLNDESGGIGWGSVEAMGEILKRNRTLAAEFESILFSYIDPQGNFLEHEMLQRGSLWGVGTYLESCVSPDTKVMQSILPFLESKDPVKRGYALRAAMNIDDKSPGILPAAILSDKSIIPIFNGWHIIELPVHKIYSGTLVE